MHIDYKVMKYRPNVVSFLIGCRFLDKFMFSFQTLQCTVRIAKFFAKTSYYVANAFQYFFWNLAILIGCSVSTEICRISCYESINQSIEGLFHEMKPPTTRNTYRTTRDNEKKIKQKNR